MADFFDDFVHSFVPLFVAVDAIGVVPVILGLSGHLDRQEQSRMLRYAMLTALGLGLGFVAVGKGVLSLLDISESHFLVAGGAILFVLSTKSLLVGDSRESLMSPDGESIGVFPIGVPLVVGPAVLTTLLVLIDRYSVGPVLAAFLINLTCAWLIFRQSAGLAKYLGRGGLSALSKIAMLLLATIAVRMIHRGVLQLIDDGDSLLQSVLPISPFHAVSSSHFF